MTTLAVFQMTVVDATGAPIPAASVRVKLAGTATDAVLKPNRDGSGTKTNPFNADGEGLARFYAPDGRYDITITSGANTFSMVNVVLLSDVPSVGSAAAVDVSYDNTSSGLTSTDVQAALDEVATIATVNAETILSPDTPPTSANAQDDEFNTGSSIDTGKWTVLGTPQGTDIKQGQLRFLPKLTGSRHNSGYVQTVPGGSWEYTMKLHVFNGQTSTLLGFILATSSGASGNMIVFGYNASNQQVFVQRLTNNTTFSANVSTTSGFPAVGPTKSSFPYYFRVSYDGTTLKFWISADGRDNTYVQLYSETSAGFLGTPNLIGMGGDNEDGTNQAALFLDWFRKTA